VLKKIAQLIKSFDNIMIICHIRADGDTLGSAYALKEALENLNKKVCVACDTPITPKYQYITNGVSQLLPEFDPEHVICVDVATEKLIGESLSGFLDRVDVVIDHHPTNSLYGKENYVEADKGATGEIIYKLIKEMGCEITPKIAEYIYIAISTDTGCFRYSNTTAESLRTTAELYEFGIPASEINRRFFETTTKNNIALQKMIFDRIHFYRQGTIAFLIISLDMIEKTGVNEDDVESMTVYPRRIEGVEVGIVMREIEVNKYKVSARSNDYIDVSKICQKYGGGGHIKAAGCTIAGDPLDIERDLATDIIEAFEESQENN